MLSDGLQCTELNVRPMAGALFSPALTPILGRLHWTETAVAKLLNNLLWTLTGRGATARERVHYGPLDVEDLGRVYEALLELEPGITAEPMCRLRRAKLEVVVPAAQGERYKPAEAPAMSEPSTLELASEEAEPDDDQEESGRGKKTKVEWIEEIPADRFYLRVGLGRKATGSFYTPHSFVRFLVRETLGPLVQRVSPPDDPQPCTILKLKLIDKAMGSGHFLVESCRFLGEALYDAARRCDELAASAEKLAESYRASTKTKPEHQAFAEEQGARAAMLRQRVIDLPDPDDELLRYLPSRSVEGTAGGVSHNKASALCRRMVAVHCLYGVDKNPLAVELAKLALWIECHAEGLPLTFLDHRLAVGDSLTGPFFEHLLKYPGSQQPLDDLFTQGLTAKLTAALADALQHVRALEATVGVTVADIEAKQAAKTRLDRALASFKILSAAWSGGVMLGTEGCDDSAYAALAKFIAETGKLPDDWLSAIGTRSSVALWRMIAQGLGLPTLTSGNSDFLSLLARQSANAIPALPFDLAFPEVFYPDANLAKRVGFDADIGNPPWDSVRPKSREFFAAFDFDVLSSPSKRERTGIEKRLLEDPIVSAVYASYINEFEALQRIHARLTQHQVAIVYGEKTGGDPDLAKLFLERSNQLLAIGGFTGAVVPGAFHSAEGATGLRRLYLNTLKLHSCFCFQNKKKLFDIVTNVKFDVLVASRSAEPTSSFNCAFYLHDDTWLFEPNQSARMLAYTPAFVASTSGEHLTFLELRSQGEFEIAKTCFANGEALGKIFEKRGMSIGRELHMTDDAWRFTPVGELVNSADSRDPDQLSELTKQGYLVVSEDDSIHLYNDHWTGRPVYLLSVTKAQDKPNWLRSACFYRLLFRRIATVVDARSFMAAVVPPGWLTASPQAHRSAGKVPSYVDLLILSLLGSFTSDWNLRLRITATLNLFIVENVPAPKGLLSVSQFLCHEALRLTCNHAGYAPLWRDQLGEAWREEGTAFTWPVLSSDDTRWPVRAAIDAVVAHAYGLTRDQYAHILSTFSHSSYKGAPRQCLAAFDELQSIGLKAFTKNHDPYWDIPLNETLPQPVIDLPITAATHGEAPRPRTGELFDFQATAASPGGGRLFTDQPVTKNRRKGGKL